MGEHWKMDCFFSSGFIRVPSYSTNFAVGAKISYVVCGYVVSRLTLNVFGLAVSTFQQFLGGEA